MTSSTAAEEVVKEAERIMMLSLLLVDALLTAAIELSTLLSVNKYLMRC